MKSIRFLLAAVLVALACPAILVRAVFLSMSGERSMGQKGSSGLG